MGWANWKFCRNDYGMRNKCIPTWHTMTQESEKKHKWFSLKIKWDYSLTTRQANSFFSLLTTASSLLEQSPRVEKNRRGKMFFFSFFRSNWCCLSIHQFFVCIIKRTCNWKRYPLKITKYLENCYFELKTTSTATVHFAYVYWFVTLSLSFSFYSHFSIQSGHKVDSQENRKKVYLSPSPWEYTPITHVHTPS